MASREPMWSGGAAKGILVAAFLWAALAILAVAAADAGVAQAGTDAGTVTSLAPDVERLVERTKPDDWALRRACLYYAFAGQHLLAQRGILASVWVGAMVYDPGTAASHQIWPHAWLVTATHFIDYSALPRWGTVKAIPRHLVARSPGEVRPGRTRVGLNPRPLTYSVLPLLGRTESLARSARPPATKLSPRTLAQLAAWTEGALRVGTLVPLPALLRSLASPAGTEHDSWPWRISSR